MTGPRGRTRIPVQGRLTLNNLEAVRHAALRGLGLSLLPRGHCEADLERGTLRRVLPRLALGGAGLWVVYPRTRFVSARVRAFVDYMVAALAPG